MKKITLFFALSFVSLIGFAQESKNSTNLETESLKRHTEYIIVLDDTTVGDNIDILFGYADGKSASLYASLKNNAGIGTELICESGVISIQRMSDGTQVTVLSKEGVEEEIFEYQPEAGGYQYEAMEVMRCMDKGLLESEKVPLSFSTSLINTLDRIREFAGIVYNDRE